MFQPCVIVNLTGDPRRATENQLLTLKYGDVDRGLNHGPSMKRPMRWGVG